MLAPASATRNASGAKRLPSRKARTHELHTVLASMQSELMGHALRLARRADVAQDLVQDAVERAIRYQDNYRPGSNARAWAHQILQNIFITSCRRSRCERNALGVLSTDPCSWTLSEQSPEMQHLSPPVQRALDRLPMDFRSVVVLVDIQEMSYQATAKRLRVPVGTVMSRLHRGRKLLAEALCASRATRFAA
jgi:RNA polymerase sigma-70 factor (ECF subfamily)